MTGKLYDGEIVGDSQRCVGFYDGGILYGWIVGDVLHMHRSDEKLEFL